MFTVKSIRAKLRSLGVRDTGFRFEWYVVAYQSKLFWLGGCPGIGFQQGWNWLEGMCISILPAVLFVETKMNLSTTVLSRVISFKRYGTLLYLGVRYIIVCVFSQRPGRRSLVYQRVSEMEEGG
ncbi:hypothetical protein HanRHA438_Chr10g0474491 [Helianthus annuus]|nr:hypothetical protein HanHA300_Chr10g0379451 [Helianthus annuus]KAJ0523820.1 hypothetical protein HanIR_Chr10g0497931 [Helianthus annuus]KAJ0531527.1 hypothetical protein HanHA89_Chr10g0402031 [Helianthus annuus]KAJ0777336.1 hypothetical protein HanLR1_Chr02g0056211 [Helianthus annuus]KAJ0881455.1 hypothetical protein HanRHA438_Chr10g0474491 [Helianthus annuus]